jgi:hypothetical protein
VTVGGVAGTWVTRPEHIEVPAKEVFKHTVLRAVSTSFGSTCVGGFVMCFFLTTTRLMRLVLCHYPSVPFLTCCGQYLGDVSHGALHTVGQSPGFVFGDWTYTYIGLYDVSFIEAGRHIQDLFRHVGWTAMLSDNVVGGICLMMSFAVGVISSLLALLTIITNPYWFADMALHDAAAFCIV